MIHRFLITLLACVLLPLAVSAQNAQGDTAGHATSAPRATVAPFPQLDSGPAWSECTTLAARKAPRARGAARHLPAGTTLTYAQRTADINTGEQSWGTSWVYVKTGATDTAYVAGLLAGANRLHVTYTDSTITIQPQVVYNHPTYGDVYICYVDWQQKAYSSRTPIVGTIDAKGNIHLDGCGLFLISGPNRGGSFGAYRSVDMHVANGEMTNSFANVQDSTETYPVYIEQTYANQLSIYNFADNRVAITAYVNPDSTIEIAPQTIYTNSTYGDFMCNPADWSQGTSAQKGSITGTASATQIDLGNWGIFSRLYPSLWSYAYRWSRITYAPGTIGYPVPTPLTWTGSGTEADPYLLTTAQQVEALAESVNYGESYEGKHIALGNDIDMGTLKQVFRPIGRSEEKPFAGRFDGRGHTIKNLTITMGQEPYAGLFGYATATGDAFKNVTIDSLRLTSYGEYAGGLVACTFGNVSNVHVTHALINHYNCYGGGIAGYVLQSEVNDCDFTGTLNGSGSTGCIVGLLRASKANRCHADAGLTFLGDVNHFYRGVGGIVGNTMDMNGFSNQSEVNDCYYAGTIIDADGHGVIGGIVGNMNGGIMRRCMNASLMSGRATNAYNGIVGGLVGMTYGSLVSDCWNGNQVANLVSAEIRQVGGLVGYILRNNSHNTLIKNCLNTGEVRLSTTIGREGLYGVNIADLSVFDHSYFDRQINGNECPDSIAAFSLYTRQLTSGEALEGFDPQVWQFTAGLYPQLKQFASLPVSQMLASPLTLNGNETVLRVKNAFTVSSANQAEWNIYTDNGLVKESDALTISGQNVTLKKVSAEQMLGCTVDGGQHYRFINLQTVNPSGFVGSGTESDPYLIQNKEDLITLNRAVTQDKLSFTGDFFRQTNDIDLAYDRTFAGIGDDGRQTHTFDGTYDGGGFTIHRLLIDSIKFNADSIAQRAGSRKVAGFFGYCNSHSVIKNLNLASDCVIRAYEIAGGIAAVTLGRIENCRSHASVTAMADYAAGIAAQSVTGSVIENCYNSGAITAGGTYAGGIVAAHAGTVRYCQNDGQVQATYITGSANATGQHTAGGVVASANGSKSAVIGCVNAGAVHSLTDVGGISSGSMNTTIYSRNLNYGMVSYSKGNGTIGAVLAYNPPESAYASNYYDKQIANHGAARDGDNEKCVGLLTGELTSGQPVDSLTTDWLDLQQGMYPVLKAFASEPAAQAHRKMVAHLPNSQTIDNFRTRAQLAKTDTLQWSLKQGQHYKITAATTYFNLAATIGESNTSLRDTLVARMGDYVKEIPLRSVPKLFDGEGTASNPYQIKTLADMQLLSRFTTQEEFGFSGEHFKVMNDIDMAADTAFAPVASGNVPFQAEFDGGGHTLSHLTINAPQDENVALFHAIGIGGSIHDLTLKEANVVALRYAAGFVGQLQGQAWNLDFGGRVSTPKNPYAAGLVANLYGGASIKTSVNHGDIAPAGGTGAGIAVGANSNSLIERCTNEANINNPSTSGIVAMSQGVVRDCANHGNINSSGYVGGIVGSGGGDSIIACVNTGIITATGNSVGGITGATSASSRPSVLIGCHNTADVSGKDYVGGLVGQLRPGFLASGCWNSGNVTATGNYVGGFVGSCSSGNYAGRITRSHNTGMVVGNRNVGGFAGEVSNGLNLDSCYNTGDVLATSYQVGGFAGYARSCAFTDCWNSGNVESDGYSVGGFVGYSQGRITRCVNVGNVTSTNGTGNSGNYGNAAGLVAQSSATVTDCYNMGNVSGPSMTGGLIGASMSSTSTSVSNVYTAGTVTCTAASMGAVMPDGRYPLYQADSAYYDTWQFTGTPSANDGKTTGLTTPQMTRATLGDAWVLREGFYPTLAAQAGNPVLDFFAATPVLSDGDTWQNVAHQFIIGTPDSTVWTCSDNLVMSGNSVATRALGPAWITKTFGNFSRTYNLQVTAISGVNPVEADAAVVRTEYFGVNGVSYGSSRPQMPGIYIERVTYSNGTTKQTKIRN